MSKTATAARRVEEHIRRSPARQRLADAQCVALAAEQAGREAGCGRTPPARRARERRGDAGRGLAHGHDAGGEAGRVRRRGTSSQPRATPLRV
jgi:hypothetical protein